MSSIVPLFHLFNPNLLHLTKHEKVILEAVLFFRLCDELKAYFRTLNKDYFQLLKLNFEMENLMLEDNFIKFIIMDILQSEEYTISGIANYSQVPEEVIVDVVLGRNLSPSASFLRKMIALHTSVRSDLYRAIMKKIIFEYAHDNNQ